MLSFVLFLSVDYSVHSVKNERKSFRQHGEPQALATEIWGKICPPSDQEAIV